MIVVNRSVDAVKVLRMRVLLAVSLLLLVSTSLLAGCTSDDLYAPCSLQGTTVNAKEKICSTSLVSRCVISEFIQCETRACGKYDAEQAFCTKKCDKKEDCGKGECRAFLVGETQKFCVSPDALKSQAK